MTTLHLSEPLALALISAVRSGDLEVLRRELARDPALVKCRIDGRTLLHVVTDWPGNFPNGAEAVATLVAAGADVNAAFEGAHSERPLHWAASSDDVAVLDALLDAGADIEAPGAVVGGGTALADAVAFGQWKAARRLIERGARTTLAEAAALGLLERLAELLGTEPPPSHAVVTRAFWYACHGGQRAAAEVLLARGADPGAPGFEGLAPIEAAERSGALELVAWLRTQGVGSQGA